MNQLERQLLKLLSNSIWNKQLTESCFEIDKNDYLQICTLAETQSVLPFVLYDIAFCDIHGKTLRNKLIATVIRNEQLMSLQDALMQWFSEAELPCVILKGSSLSICYPKPEVRQLGDIDVLVWPQDMEKASDILRAHGYKELEADHPFHLHFRGVGGIIELHHAVSTFPNTSGGCEAKRVMQECLNHTQVSVLDGHEFPVLMDEYQALSLLLHMERHMVESGIGLRQLCDWAVFVNHVKTDYFTGVVLPLLERCGMAQFAKVLTKTCVRFLDLDAEHVSWCMDVEDSLADAMMEEILRTGNFGRAADENESSSFLVDGDSSKTAIHVLLQRLNASARRDFPITKKAPVLLPVFWIYLPIRYWIRSLMGLRPRKSIRKTVSTAQKRKQLYDDLHLFEIQ